MKLGVLLAGMIYLKSAAILLIRKSTNELLLGLLKDILSINP